MREIKFRGKSVKSGKWLYGYLGEAKDKVLQTTYCEKVIFENLSWFNTDNFGYVVNDYMVDKVTIGQFTGLHDKNGEEIYEGDIVKSPILDPIFGDTIKDAFCNAEIRFNKGSFVVSYYKGEHNIYIQDLCDKIEVIGNIHDNMDLLED